MADVADRADALVAALAEQALERHRANALLAEATGTLSPGAPRDCLDCGMPVPAQRIAAVPHTQRCIECQQMAEAAGWL